ncbi:hypothetical protein PN466_10810 [Roseofilum reptotaenium CS-1145]|uniref:Uncharacterized protein n=1 Tax=Roseofilum reptotaenium AO1-A TaxID=1925591 RepID=A0A1L9QM67_9CYAN|nr:hypothetical protein [Roseofilum reptotaenium]MDB9517439.1 hypothetical protein [Roseofilum reptotaenium CS-1145]OJJ20712.1 hypothetical protein BI308_20670 [Roseofilum reptotaenium AO1-A]
MLEALNGAVYLQALEDDQIQRYLRGLGRGELWRQIQRDEGLLELARIPLFLHLIPVAYPQGIESQGTGGQQTQAALLEKYVERKLDEPNAKGARKYTPEQTRRYLTWLARSLKQQRQTDSYIEEMQPILLATKGERLVYRLIVGMIEGMFLGVMVGMILEGFEGLFFKLIGGLIGGLIDGVIFGTVGLSIELTEAFDFSQKKIKKGIIYWLVLALILGVFFDAIFGIIFGGIVGLIRGLRADLNYRSKANQGILESAKNAITVFLITLPATMLIFILPEFVTGRSVDFTNTLISGLGLSAILSFSFGGGLACIQHLVLRVMLCQKEVIAWNYSQFLTYAAERRLLNQVGGRYRFLHDKLREHFAGDARTPGSR